MQSYSKILVKNHIIDLVLCQKCSSKSHRAIQYIAREAGLHWSSGVPRLRPMVDWL